MKKEERRTEARESLWGWKRRGWEEAGQFFSCVGNPCFGLGGGLGGKCL